MRKLEQLQVVCFALHEAKVLPENADQRSGHPPYMRHWSGADTPTDISSPLSTPGSTSSESTPTFLRKAKFLDTQRDDEEARAIGSHAQLLVERAAAADDKPALAACYRSLPRAHAQSRAQLKATSRSQRHRKRRTYLRPRPRWRRLLQRRLFWSGSEMSSSS